MSVDLKLCKTIDAIAENISQSLKVEEVYRNTYKNYEHANIKTFKYIEYFESSLMNFYLTVIIYHEK